MPWMDGSWDAHLASPAFAGADDITKKREPGIEIIERTPLDCEQSLFCSKIRREKVVEHESESLFCSKIRREKVVEHESRASGEAASSARGGRRAKRETAMVSYNDCEAL